MKIEYKYTSIEDKQKIDFVSSSINSMSQTTQCHALHLDQASFNNVSNGLFPFIVVASVFA